MSFHFDSDNDNDSRDDDSRDDSYVLDTTWIQDVENEILYDEYCNFIIEDVNSIPITFLYINKHRNIIDSVHFIAKLKIPNQISQDEILHIIKKYQIRKETSHINKKSIMMYYNFYSMIHYSFYVKEDPKSISSYLLEDHDDADNEFNADIVSDVELKNIYSSSSSCIKEYSNIISIHTLYFKPMLRLFKDISSLTIILNED